MAKRMGRVIMERKKRNKISRCNFSIPRQLLLRITLRKLEEFGSERTRIPKECFAIVRYFQDSFLANGIKNGKT